MQKSRPYYLRTVLLLFGSSLLLVSIVASCRKDSTTNKPVFQVELAGFPGTFNFNCTDSPVYEDSILCAKYRGPDRDYFAKPLNRLPNGKYYSWPAGLVMDATTGIINVT